MQDSRKCQYCDGILQDGFLEDSTDGRSNVSRWIPGPIEKGILGSAKVWGKTRYDVVARACEKCGRIELALR